MEYLALLRLTARRSLLPRFVRHWKVGVGKPLASQGRVTELPATTSLSWYTEGGGRNIGGTTELPQEGGRQGKEGEGHKKENNTHIHLIDCYDLSQVINTLEYPVLQVHSSSIYF